MTMKTMIPVFATLMAATVMAEVSPPSSVKPIRPFSTNGLTQAQIDELRTKNLARRAEVRQRILERTGGPVVVHPDGPSILILDAQKTVPHEVLERVGGQVEAMIWVPVDHEQGVVKDVLKDVPARLGPKTKCVLAVCDIPGLPDHLVAPGAFWGVVNVAPLKADNPDAELLAKRVRKTVWRAFVSVLGGANSMLASCLMRPIATLADLDGITQECPCPEPFNKMMKTTEFLGIKQNRRGSYKKALEEGWAPPPKNKYQQKIFDDFQKLKSSK